jgi:uncharacterized protein
MTDASGLSDRNRQIEDFARQHLLNGEIAHDYKHVDRVRRHALWIAEQEGYPHRDRVQAVALLHDIALGKVENRREHGKVGADMAAAFLREKALFDEAAIEEIANAIRWHDSVKQDDSPLLAILRDADMLEIFGAVGLLRGITSRATMPDYDADNIRGETWGFSARDFDPYFADGRGIGPTLIDHINWQMSCLDNLNTESAKRLARPLVFFMGVFVEQFVREVEGPGDEVKPER